MSDALDLLSARSFNKRKLGASLPIADDLADGDLVILDDKIYRIVERMAQYATERTCAECDLFIGGNCRNSYFLCSAINSGKYYMRTLKKVGP